MKKSGLFKFAKKGSKKIKKSRGGSGAGKQKYPPGIRIGIFGHENTSKTVYLTVLYHQSKIDKKLQISVTDNDTSNEFLSNYMSIWGFDSGTSMGTIVNQAGEKKFPKPTEKDKILQFTAIIEGNKKVPVVTYDYSGKTVSISEYSDEAEKVNDFMASADGLLFFFDPKILGADMEVQARVSAFISALEQVAPLRSRLSIPIGLVVTKSDILPGYKGEENTILISSEDEQFVSEGYEEFLEKVLSSSNVTANSEWASSVRKILVKLSEFLRVVVGRTLDFQIFFISNTGNAPIKVGTDVGRSIYQPPEKITPCGVREPFYWILNSVMRSRKLNVMRKVVKYVVAASLIWTVVYSAPFLLHFAGLLSSPQRVEKSVLKSVEGNHLNTSETQRMDIIRAYSRYSDKWLVKKFFPDFRVTSIKMKEVYQDFNMGPALERLDGLINDITKIIQTPALRPKYDPGLDSLMLDNAQMKIKSDLEAMHVGGKGSVLYERSDRALRYWELFTELIKAPRDTALFDKIDEQVAFNSKNAQNYTDSEKQLGNALLSSINISSPEPVRSARSTRSAVGEYDKLKERINNSTDPKFVLEDAAGKLASIKGSLGSAAHGRQISAINEFIASVEKYKKKQTYTCILQTVPDFGHLHIEVTGSSGEPTWSKAEEVGQLLEGSKLSFKWKAGDDIHIAFDELGYCNWGNKPSDKVVLQSEYAIFEMQGSITFSNIGKTVKISFKPELKLPKLK
ncbi:MAG: GTPase domain-containing protein [Candidatus Krumholzibacteriota bacterium]|nr:GTPase domain-containing protein [Candidatus Krumholzibacteriota bacterium]